MLLHRDPFWTMGVSHGVMYASSGADKKRDDSYPNHRKADALVMRTPADKLVRWIRHIHGATGAGSGSAPDRNNGRSLPGSPGALCCSLAAYQ